MRKCSSPNRVTVKSHSIPPLGLSICVYVTCPMSRATRLAQRPSRNSAAPGPVTSSFANEVSSKSAAASRQARCSAPIAGDQIFPAQPRGRSDSSPAAAFDSNQFARSQPDFSPKEAPSLGEPLVGGGDPQRPPAEALLAGVLHVVVGRVALDRARERVLAAAVVRPEAARVHLPRVEPRLAVHDPFGHELPHAAGAREPMRAEPGRDPEAAHVGLAEDELAVGRERLGAVDQLHDLGVLEGRHTDDCVRHELLEALPVLGEELPVEVGRDAVERPRRRLALVAAHHEPAGLPAEIDEETRVAHRRHVERHVHRARDEVLVRHRDDRHLDPCERAKFPCENPAGVDHDLRFDRALVGLDADYPPVLDPDRGDARVRVDLRAAAAGALGERERELARVDVAVGGEVGRAEHAVGRHGREHLLRPLRGDELQRQPERLRPAGLARELLHPFLGGRKPQRADLVPAGLEVDLLAERPVELDRVHHHPRQRERAAQLADEPGRVEGRAARQVGALDQDDVVPAQARKPVEDRGAADTAADDDGARLRFHASACWNESDEAVRSSRSKCSCA